MFSQFSFSPPGSYSFYADSKWSAHNSSQRDRPLCRTCFNKVGLLALNFWWYYQYTVALKNDKKNNLAIKSDPPPSGTFLIQPCWVWRSWTFSPDLLPRQSSRWSTTTTVRIWNWHICTSGKSGSHPLSDEGGGCRDKMRDFITQLSQVCSSEQITSPVVTNIKSISPGKVQTKRSPSRLRAWTCTTWSGSRPTSSSAPPAGTFSTSLL